MNDEQMKKQPVEVRLMDMASQENCDGEPYDTMAEAYQEIKVLQAKCEALEETVGRLRESLKVESKVSAHLSRELEALKDKAGE